MMIEKSDDSIQLGVHFNRKAPESAEDAGSQGQKPTVNAEDAK